MSAKLIIWISGKPTLHGYKRREFIWSEAHKCYLYGGAEIESSEFNEKYDKAMKTNADMNPRVKVVGTNGSSVTNGLVTLEQAEEVFTRLAPERLKKKTGPKPATVEV